VKALIALSKAHSARGMYDDAMQDLRQAHQLLNEFYEEIHCDVRVEVLREFASLLMECGVREEAELLFRHAVTEAEDMPRPEGIVHEVNLVFSLASILSKEKPVEARTLIERCYDLLDQLPPSHEPVSRTELKLLLLFIDGDEEGAEALEEMAASRLHELQYQYGEGFVSAQAHLMFQKANSLIKIWNLQDARKELERAKQLLERHAKDKTSLYAMVLSRLADTLSPDDSRVFEYRERADEIRRRAEQAGEQLNSRDQEDPDDQ